ncbi:MAG TPA: hypothetical protein VJT32_07590, partial [bacterium]|nr:hypothetical protein [bacterium]
MIRLAVLLAVIPALWVGVIPLTSPVLLPILALLGGYVILLAVGPRWVTGLGQADLTVGLDLMVTTLLVTVSGGIDSPFRYLYYLVILSAAARLNIRQAVAASFATAGIIVLLWIRTTGHATLITPGFEVGTFISGGFLLALILGVLTQEKRWIAVLYQTQARRTAELEALHRLGEHLRAARSTDDMFPIVTAEAMRVTGSDHAAPPPRSRPPHLHSRRRLRTARRAPGDDAPLPRIDRRPGHGLAHPCSRRRGVRLGRPP